MRKFFEKHDLFKLAGFAVIIYAILTWIYVPFETGSIGLFDLFTYGSLGFNEACMDVAFILFVLGFYKFLGSLKEYQELTAKIANKLKGKELLTVAVSMLLVACFTGVTSQVLAALVFIPFIISILSKMEINKFAGFAATFGGMVIGLIGATYSAGFVGNIYSSAYGLNLEFGEFTFEQVILFVLAYGLLLFISAKNLKNTKNQELVDLLATEEVESNKKVVTNKTPLVVTLIITAIILLLGYISWDTFGVTYFQELADKLANADVIGGVLGSQAFVPFGNWDLFPAILVLFFAALIIKIMYRVPLNNCMDEFGEGFKKSVPMIAVYFVLAGLVLLGYSFPVLDQILTKLLESSNFVVSYIAAFLGSFFNPDILYYMVETNSIFATIDSTVAVIALQSAFGVVSIIAPTSYILAVGLPMLNIKYKDWFKYIWKFAVGMIAISLVVLAILA